MHNIEYYTYDENIKRDWVQAELDHHAAMEDYQEGCKGLGAKIRWLETEDICADEEAAAKRIKELDRGWYDQLAVRYYEPIPCPASKKQGELEQRMAAAYNLYLKRDLAIYPQTLTAEYIGCKECGSKLARKRLNKNRCPVCGADLRPKSMLDMIQSAKESWEKAKQQTRDYISSHSEKAVKWLVKIEYHT